MADEGGEAGAGARAAAAGGVVVNSAVADDGKFDNVFKNGNVPDGAEGFFCGKKIPSFIFFNNFSNFFSVFVLFRLYILY